MNDSLYNQNEEQFEALSERLFYISDDLRELDGYAGHVLSEPRLYGRLLSILSADERKTLLRNAYEELHKMDRRHGKNTYNICQFVAYHYSEAFGHSLTRFAESPAEIKLDQLSSSEKNSISSMLNGNNHYGLGAVISMTTHLGVNPSESIRCLQTAVMSTVNGPHNASALISGVDYNYKDLLRIESTGDVILSEEEALLKILGPEADNDYQYSMDMMFLRGKIKWSERARENIVGVQKQIISLDSLVDRYGLEETPTGLFIPIRSRIVIAKSLTQAIADAERDRSTVLDMSPRKFEEFIAHIFEVLGFEVELTQCTRDGGADLLCLKSLHGIPFRLAVEVKRYKDNPITVSLVKSFVGSNKIFQANKLLYITTSRYTAPAVEYAEKYASNLLSLKQYEQIQEWCKEIRLHIPRLL